KYSFAIKPVSVKQLVTDEITSPEYFKGSTVHAVAGIGHPERFFNMLKGLGINVIEHAYADHYQFTAEDLEFNDDLAVLMTEKDSVKCNDINNSKLWFVSIDIELSEQFIIDFKKQVDKLTHG
ncbi:MAG: tetraacyldisaccharide 4'-kinase, partial [Gammaproteobacteria bacterium]|nr:tetraacyldisaccharide 4'-kinase [Gammaproteobacteria bacterium]